MNKLYSFRLCCAARSEQCIQQRNTVLLSILGPDERCDLDNASIVVPDLGGFKVIGSQIYTGLTECFVIYTNRDQNLAVIFRIS